MKKIKIDVVAVPLSGHLYPTLNLVKPLLDDPSMEIRVFTGPQKKAVAESLGFTVVPILEDKVEEFERAANNDKKLNLFSAARRAVRGLWPAPRPPGRSPRYRPSPSRAFRRPNRRPERSAP